jgi:hypothetical protein
MIEIAISHLYKKLLKHITHALIHFIGSINVSNEKKNVLFLAKCFNFRFIVAILLFICNIICYIDRTSISIAIIPMSSKYKWTNTINGYILSSFFFGYIITQIPGG